MTHPGIPLVDQSHLGKRGFFYVGGRYTEEEGKHFRCNQMFVEVYEPREVTKPYPLILMHGAGQTNMNWLMTPDGRPGWADYFVSQGYTVYLTEQPARARSAYHPAVNGPAIFHSAEDLTTRFTSNRGGWPQAKLHSQFPGEPGCWENEVTVQFLSAQVEYLPSNKASQELMLAAGRELLALTGPAVLITHSQAGPFGWLLADDKPELVQGIVALEPSGPPFSGDLKNPKAKNYGITDVNMRFDPPVASPEDFELELLKAPGENLSDGWVMKEPCPKLPSLQGIPIALLVSEASYHAGYDHLTSHVLKQLGVDHRFVRLEDVGIHGNGHMMMLEKNNLEIAAWVSQWLQENVNTREKDD